MKHFVAILCCIGWALLIAPLGYCNQFLVIITEDDITKMPSNKAISVVDYRTSRSRMVTLSETYEVHSLGRDIDGLEKDRLLYCRLPVSISQQDIDKRRIDALAAIDLEELRRDVFADLGRACIVGSHTSADTGSRPIQYKFCPKGNLSRIVEAVHDFTTEDRLGRGQRVVQTLGQFSVSHTKLHWSHAHRAFELHYPDGDECRTILNNTAAKGNRYREFEENEKKLVHARIILRCLSRQSGRKMLWALNFVHSECLFQIEMGIESVCSAMSAVNDAPEVNPIVCNDL